MITKMTIAGITLLVTLSLVSRHVQPPAARAAPPNEPQVSVVDGTDTQEKMSSELRQLVAELKELLAESQECCRELDCYTAVLQKQVNVDGALREPEEIEIRIREQPHSVYMTWTDDGKRALYVEGENGGRLVAKPTNGLSALRETWRLKPESAVAMKDCRYPITELGLRKLSNRVASFYEELPSSGVRWIERTDAVLDGQRLIHFAVRFQSPQESADYACSSLWFDPETKQLVAVENSGWSQDGECGELLERYHYREIDHTVELEDVDFEF